jgi:hypothetical protein
VPPKGGFLFLEASMAIENVEVRLTKSRQNIYNVPLKQWRKWGSGERQVFNEVYSSMRRNQWIFKHPKAAKDSREHWKTTCWNAAWTAAAAAKDAGE